MSISRWVDKEVVVHIHNGIWLNCRKECIWVSSNEVNETRAFYTEWRKSERETPILHIDTCIWNLERWYWWSYMQGSKRDTDVKNRLLDSVGEGEGEMIWENNTEICILPYVKQVTSASSVHESGHSEPVLWYNPEGWGGQGGGRGFRMGGTHVHLWLIHVDVWRKPTTIL